MLSTTSPGRNRIMPNTSTEMPNSVGTSRTSRRRTYWPMASPRMCRVQDEPLDVHVHAAPLSVVGGLARLDQHLVELGVADPNLVEGRGRVEAGVEVAVRIGVEGLPVGPDLVVRGRRLGLPGPRRRV